MIDPPLRCGRNNVQLLHQGLPESERDTNPIVGMATDDYAAETLVNILNGVITQQVLHDDPQMRHARVRPGDRYDDTLYLDTPDGSHFWAWFKDPAFAASVRSELNVLLILAKGPSS